MIVFCAKLCNCLSKLRMITGDTLSRGFMASDVVRYCQDACQINKFVNSSWTISSSCFEAGWGWG